MKINFNPETVKALKDMLRMKLTKGMKELCQPDADDVRAQDALALIEHLEAQVPRWIPVEERLPDECVMVLFIQSGRVILGYYYNSEGVFENLDGYEFLTVTHWMPLPELPKGEK